MPVITTSRPRLLAACILCLLATYANGQASSKVVGGESASVRQYPFFVALLNPERALGAPPYDVLCGASLITSSYLLTAAHCFNGVPASRRAQKYLPAFLMEDRCQGRPSRTVRATQVTVHPSYNAQNFRNDIAVMRLAEIVSYTPVQLPPARTSLSGRGTVIGYGNTRAKAGSYPCVLQMANIQIFSRSQCLRTGNRLDMMSLHNTLCAGRLTGGVDTCDGDSGGPLLRQLQGTTVIQGITSFGNGCARPGYPGVYTDVSKYVRWIRQATGQSQQPAENAPEDNIYCRQNWQDLINFFNLCRQSANKNFCDCDNKPKK